MILQVDSVKYLGHYLTNDLHDDLDIRRQCRAINVRGNILSGNFTCVVYRWNWSYSIPIALLCILFTCGGIFLLRFYVYSSLVSICKLQITYHNILKMKIGLSKYESTSATCAITNTQCCQSVIRNLVYKFVCTTPVQISLALLRKLSSFIFLTAYMCPSDENR